jgi:hypothetical protein
MNEIVSAVFSSEADAYARLEALKSDQAAGT